MSYDKIKKELAPCGIDCFRCVSYSKGNVAKLSRGLKENLANFENMAKRIEDFMPLFKKYNDFIQILEHFSSGECKGCREGYALNNACKVKDCHKEEKVDFCFRCDKYPCDKNNNNNGLYNKWKDNNDEMKQNGVQAFYKAVKSKPRY
ncbi:DUF3795 domain-containing protein [Clostridiaceae bacterium M8S5]|nr:DUF3795 domain-containing protein [Clostridiaceae bacterium M8S5]